MLYGLIAYYIVITQNGDKILGYPELIVNLKKPQKFVRARRLSGNSKYELSSFTYRGDP